MDLNDTTVTTEKEYDVNITKKRYWFESALQWKKQGFIC